MPNIAWRAVPGLPQEKAQDGTAFIFSDGQVVQVSLAVRPARGMRSHRPTLTLIVDGNHHLFKPTMRQCKGGAERVLRHLERAP